MIEKTHMVSNIIQNTLHLNNVIDFNNYSGGFFFEKDLYYDIYNLINVGLKK